MKCETWRLADLDLSDLALVKERVRWIGAEDHCRWVFRVPRTARRAGARDVYVKVWNPTYVRRDHALRALDAGFYDERTVPALRALIYHRGICRGYAMAPCGRSRRVDPVFYDAVVEATARTGLFHVDFGRYHALRYAGWYSLIDLDGVHPLGELGRMPVAPCAFGSADYERFVCTLHAGAAGMRICSHTTPPPGGAGRHRLVHAPVDKVRAIRAIARLAIVTRRPTPGPHLDRIERG
jgi:hypothetical protein